MDLQTPKDLGRCKSLCNQTTLCKTVKSNLFVSRAPQVEFMQGYGLTETSGVALQSPNDCLNSATIGFAASNTQVKVARQDDPSYTGCDIDEASS